MSILLFILGLVLFVGLVVLHELGHALMSRRHGVDVLEFGIGFPPRLWAKKLKNGSLLSLNALPLGGFVRLKGEHDMATGNGTYGAASLWAKTQILLAGVAVNWIIAVVIFTLLALIGLPQLLPDQFTIASDTIVAHREVPVAAVAKASPAERAGLKPGDQLLTMGNEQIGSAQQVVNFTKSHAGETVNITAKRGGTIQAFVLELNKNRIENQGYAGIEPAEQVFRRSTWSAPLVGLGVTAQFSWATLEGLGRTVGHLFKQEFQKAGQGVAGPVGIFRILQHSSETGAVAVLFLIGIISLTLAVMNSLPVPALDGGRLILTLIFRALRRPLSKEREEWIQFSGFVALMGLIVLITIVDVGRIIGG